MSPSKAKVGDTVRITVQGFQLGPSAVSFQNSSSLKSGQMGAFLFYHKFLDRVPSFQAAIGLNSFCLSVL